MKAKRVVVIGTTLQKFIDTKCNYLFLSCVSYHLTQTDVQLFCPQSYHQRYDGNSEVHGNHVTLRIPGHIINISLNPQQANPPVVSNSFMNEY